MDSETLPKQFIFNEKMDKDTLFGLYTDDFPYIEEIFHTTLQHFDADLDAVQAGYQNGNLPDLKKAVHKIKPTFGFMGLPQVQDYCRQFEEDCATAPSVTALSSDFIQLKNTLLEARDLIQSEYLRLKIFNA